ncbi:uncharacterized protein LOC129942114 isoform X2 [Eupeodes corollae]|nr:uncharacterized protein LOC129942114 isoform X2 [Eupeodes corollae]
MWEILALNLNAMGPITKSIDQWKKCWTDLKSGVRKQCNSRKAFFNRTGGGSIGNAPRDLNEFEEKILAIISTHAVDGDGLTPESGVALNTPIIEMESDECPESQPKKEFSYKTQYLGVADKLFKLMNLFSVYHHPSAKK